MDPAITLSVIVNNILKGIHHITSYHVAVVPYALKDSQLSQYADIWQDANLTVCKFLCYVSF